MGLVEPTDLETSDRQRTIRQRKKLERDPSRNEPALTAIMQRDYQSTTGRWLAWLNHLRTKELKLGMAHGYYGKSGTPKLLSYNPNHMWCFWAIVFNKKLTSFHGHMQSHLIWSLYIPVVAVLTLWAIDGFKPIDDGVAKSGRRWAILVESVMMERSTAFRGLIGYVLGGFVARAFTMWYLRRKNYAAFCGTCRNLVITMAAAVPMGAVSPRAGSSTAGSAESDPFDAVAIAELRRRLGRWAVLAHELGTLKARGAVDSDDGRIWLLKSGLLEEGEWEVMVNGDRHTTVLFWISMACRRLAAAGAMGSPEMSLCVEAVGFMRAKANDLMSSLDRDIPYPYASLLGMLVKTNVALMTAWRTSELYLNLCGVKMGAQNWATALEHNPNCKLWGDGPSDISSFPNQNATQFWTMVVLHLSTLFLWNMSYKAMYDLAKVLHNPFGNREIDIAHETINGGLRRLADELMGRTSKHLPPGMPPDMGGRSDAGRLSMPRELPPTAVEVPRSESNESALGTPSKGGMSETSKGGASEIPRTPKGSASEGGEHGSGTSKHKKRRGDGTDRSKRKEHSTSAAEKEVGV